MQEIVPTCLTNTSSAAIASGPKESQKNIKRASSRQAQNNFVKIAQGYKRLVMPLMKFHGPQSLFTGPLRRTNMHARAQVSPMI